MDDIVRVLNDPTSDKEKIFTAACKYFLLVYGVKKSDKNVEEFWYSRFVRNATKNTDSVA